MRQRAAKCARFFVPPGVSCCGAASSHLSRNGRAATSCRLVADGHGAGHGVGLCQWGAVGRSRAGQTWRRDPGGLFPRHRSRANLLMPRNFAAACDWAARSSPHRWLPNGRWTVLPTITCASRTMAEIGIVTSNRLEGTDSYGLGSTLASSPPGSGCCWAAPILEAISSRKTSTNSRPSCEDVVTDPTRISPSTWEISAGPMSPSN